MDFYRVLDWLGDNLGVVIGVVGVFFTILLSHRLQLRKIRKILGGMRGDIQRIEVMIRYLSEQQEYIKDLIRGVRKSQVTMIVFSVYLLLLLL